MFYKIIINDNNCSINHKFQITNPVILSLPKDQITNHKSQIPNPKSQIPNRKSQIVNP